ncbi:MAG: threonine--tRNA ligase [Candidatus Bipolaricaulis anaerobius]|nr:threonine--tRNA ligase [Candidatus Bipolaricaulis anaerobius]MDD5764433.1 threonine--tRNA ligase [Candidatus Bipolaricaulis anaerobius]
MATVVLPSGELVEVRGGDLLAVLKERGETAVAVLVDGQLQDLRDPLPPAGEARAVGLDHPAALEVLRHTASHILAHAVTRLYPGAKLAIGPAIDDGFYYDIRFPEPVNRDDLPRIEAEMRKIVADDLPIERVWLSRAEAEAFLAEKGEVYKLELLAEIPDERISFYRQGEFLDLCRGPHLPATGLAKHLTLLDVAGAYWRGDSRRDMLTRIYGTAFPTAEALAEHLKWREEARKRDHRILGPELDLFSIQNETIGAGLVLWHPKGARVRHEIETFWKGEHYNAGYQLVASPHIGRARLWEISGHLDFYKDGMYAPMDIEGQEFYLKPMNCPFHIAIYKTRTRSYRDLPIRYAELGTVYRFERSGVLHGLLRVRGFTQDDAHIICRPDQIEDEVLGCLDLTLRILGAFGFRDYKVALSVRDPEHREHYIGSDAMWDEAEMSLVRALERRGLPHTRMEGEAVFYGPKIDLHILDSLKRSWQLTTIQFDFNEPERFDMAYIGDDGQAHRPYMVHRALLGSLERFFGILIEHYGGAFPAWLAPVQAVVLPVTEAEVPYAEGVTDELRAAGIRAEAWTKERKTLRWLIREAQVQKVPYMLVCGAREAAGGVVAVRLRTGEDLGLQSVSAVVSRIREAVSSRGTML